MRRVQCLNIGEAVYQLLTNDTDVAALLGTRIYPLVAPEGTQYPYVVYNCLSMTTARDKDAYFYEQRVLEGVVICTDKYTDGVEIAMAVTKALQMGECTVELDGGNIEIMESSFAGRTEDYVSNTFVQGLTFELKIR